VNERTAQERYSLPGGLYKVGSAALHTSKYRFPAADLCLKIRAPTAQTVLDRAARSLAGFSLRLEHLPDVAQVNASSLQPENRSLTEFVIKPENFCRVIAKLPPGRGAAAFRRLTLVGFQISQDFRVIPLFANNFAFDHHLFKPRRNLILNTYDNVYDIIAIITRPNMEGTEHLFPDFRRQIDSHDFSDQLRNIGLLDFSKHDFC